MRLANDGPYGLQASVWTRDTANGERIARRVEAGVCCVNDAQLNYGALELPMGGWKASGLGSRHGPDGIRKYAKRQSLMITPGYAPPRELHMFPYSARGHPAGGRCDQPARHQRGVHGRAAAHPARPLRHPGPVAAPAVAEGDVEGRRRRRSPRLLGAGRLAPRRSRGDRGRAAGIGGDRGAARRPRLAARLARRAGDGPGGPARGPRAAHPRLLRLGPRGARRHPHAARPDAVALLRPARPRHRAEPELGRDRLSGPPAPAPGGAEAARRSPARGRGRGDDDRGRRLRGRLGGRRRGDRRDPRRGRQAGLRARARRATSTRPTSTSSRSGATRTSTCAAGRSRRPRARSRSRPARRWAAAR